MSSNNSGCSTKSELVDSVRSKAERASQLLQRMGTEPAPPCNYFKRLSVALERRRAVAARELTDWRQKRLQLQEVVWEASVAEKSNWPIDELCRVEADLDAVVGSDKPAIQKGYWNSSEVNSKINDLLQSLSISWEGHELQSFDKCLEWVAASPVTNEIATTTVDQQTSSKESNESIVWTMISQEKFVPHELPPKSSASLKDSVSVASEDSNAAAIASNSPVCQSQFVGLSSLASATFFWGNYICVDPVRRKVFQRRSDGSSSTSF
ncbi:hypothetical protein BOX15_Mlig024364g4 [Macrostomum lignano]|uniref:Uncharacterized protein n=1 Tax=Macrostomum lignano TaxID=282301 RepID=A0A267ELP0_9PLAT|nr:hypothetical protein BOX15_Mlig012779g7 [Macrostomum lignano]PAA91370.1 hypothetical protein BOX15_Mlig024364g4 [Macrostomum lignano]